MQLFTLYAATIVIFLVIDMVGISTIIKPIFQRHVGDMMADPLRLGPAAAFYLFYVVGLLWFVSVPAMAENKPVQALLGGALLGLMCYGTYEFTNLATLRGWSWNQVIVDSLWGAALTGGSAWAGLMVTRWIHG
ncbi:hypothetical protein AL036_00700 [Salipiger aestuarii]|uniref:Putative membrane protein n=1 Tax=Salipiger aestuarii TaxID=568098 RepID=A0A327YLN7_9RHOB|nr:DUF2177 family protein [Salipiger aestuarii]EIE48801.1 hypothetical protein C357_21615 [Citreicella sp. 357]KAA8610433.1 hypothetical protein AL036_00700 [Salipiger aestuarii]KAA8616449.1 hypothetical protein AL037_00695 [Salipiger aestuarii]KAB2543455.1 hypothetical protein AL035_01290 [Salipiger aestuarii]RAK21984.1 putative membrane protein [Salipiger aestuarii]